jgi:hypothetical protein
MMNVDSFSLLRAVRDYSGPLDWYNVTFRIAADGGYTGRNIADVVAAVDAQDGNVQLAVMLA